MGTRADQPVIIWTTKHDVTTGSFGDGTRVVTIQKSAGGQCVMRVQSPWSENLLTFRFSSIQAAKDWAEPVVAAWHGKAGDK